MSKSPIPEVRSPPEGHREPEALPFPFIVARGRSGTTLLRAMLDSHPRMAVPPESHFLVTMGRRRRRYEVGDRFMVDRFAGDLSQQYGFRRWDLEVEVVRKRLIRAGVSTYPEAIREVFSLYAERYGKDRYAEKTPMNIIHLPFLAKAFPEAVFIHLIRDGRDVALSYLDTDFGVDSVAEAAIYWRRFVAKGRRDGERLASRYLEVRYEDLVSDPERVLRSICEFVSLPYDPVMLSYPRHADQLLTRTSREEHHQRLRLPPTAGLRDWRVEMDPQDLQLFEALAGDLIEELGYERRSRSIDSSVRLRSLVARVVILSRRALRRLRKGTSRLRRTARGATPS